MNKQVAVKKAVDALKLLMSGAFRARCERYLRAITGNYKNTLVFQPGKVCTDGEKVWADPTSGLIMDLELVQKIIAVRGQIAHEAFHILYTDFSVVKRWAQEAKRMSPEDQFRLYQRKDFLNIVEDSAIELAGCTEFPGLAPYIRLLNETAFDKMQELGWYEANKNRLRAFMNACMMYGIIGHVRGSFTDPELIDAFERAKPHLDAGRVAPTTRHRQVESDAIWEIAKPFIEEAIALGQLLDQFENLKGNDVNENGNGQGRPMPADTTEFRKPQKQKGKGQGQEQESESDEKDEEQSSKGSKSKSEKKKDDKKSDSKSGGDKSEDEDQGGSDADEEQDEDQGGGASGQDDADDDASDEEDNTSGSGKDQDADDEDDDSSDSKSSANRGDEEDEEGDDADGDENAEADADGDDDGADEEGDQKRTQKRFADDANDGTVPNASEGDEDDEPEDDELLKELQKEVEKEIEEVLSEMEKEQLAQSQSEKRAERVKNHLANLKYSDNHANIKVRPYYPDPTDYDKSVVKEIEADVKSLSRNMTRRIQNLIRYNQEEKRSGLTNGYLNQSELWRKDGKIFAQKKDKSDEADLAILVLIDESGSMSDYGRYMHAKKAAVMIADVCEALKIPLAVIGHQAVHMRNDVEHYHYITFEKPIRDQRANLAKITHRHNTREGVSLKYAAEYLLQQPQKDKLLLVISDGDPCHVAFGGARFMGEPARIDAACVVEEYEKKGITIIGVAIGDGQDLIAEIYKNFISINKLESLPQKLVALIEKRVLKN